MTKLTDVFKKSFLEGYSNVDIGVSTVAIALILTAVIGFYIFLAYRVITRKTFYSKNFNVSLVGVAIITAAIIVTIQSSVVVSLGMVGALSIVRFRTAIKDPIDLMFLFWSIGTGIMCGAGFAEYAILLALAMSVILFALEKYPVAKAPMLLIINSESKVDEKSFTDILSKYVKSYQVKARNLSKDALNVTIELRTAAGNEIVKEIMGIEGVTHVSFLEHDGEATF